MTNRDSLVAHLAYRLSNQTELLATHSLAYILNKSEAAKAALGEVLRTGGADVGPIERAVAEVAGENEERVDLVAYNKLGEERVLIEAKFWAGLTENQPGTYLDRLPKDDRTAVLLFIAPELRLPTLWGHVLQRAKDTGARWETIADPGKLGAAVVLGRGAKEQPFVRGNRWLMLTSWRALLGAMASRADIEGDGLAGEDIRQLNALCERQDTEAFLPIGKDEFGPDVPRRLRDLRRLVDDAVARARKIGCANTEGLRVTPRATGYGTYVRLGSEAKDVWAGAWFGVSYERWLSEESRPLWIEFGNRPMPREEIVRKLGSSYRSFELPAGVEYDAVLDSVVEALRQTAGRLSGEISDEGWDEYAGTQTAHTAHAQSSAED